MIAVAWSAWALDRSEGLPDVYYRYSTGECLSVMKFQPEHKGYSCQNLPPQYNKVWAD